jgi:hypothetical protein
MQPTGIAPLLSQTMADVPVLMLLRCVDRRLFSRHHRLCRFHRTALTEAASNTEGDVESTVRLLLEHKADVNASDT